jgi:uncharacterized protein YbjT (DUF2867 family)
MRANRHDMHIGKVIVFGSTGVQGRAQLRELLNQGYRPLAVSREVDRFKAAHPDIECVSVDYGIPASIDAALAGVDAVFFQAPAMGDGVRLMSHCANLADAVTRSKVKLFVLNSSMWAPDDDRPCGEQIYDGVLAMESLFQDKIAPLIIFRPTIYMDNLLGDWIRPIIVNERVYRYPHKAELAADWISLEDVAKFMVAALNRPDLIGRKIRIGGPQRLTTLQVLEILSEVLEKPIKLEYMTPHQFGQHFFNLYGKHSGLPEKSYVDGFAGFYTFNNDSTRRPFQADVRDTLRLIPVELTDLRTWAQTQSWS